MSWTNGTVSLIVSFCYRFSMTFTFYPGQCEYEMFQRIWRNRIFQGPAVWQWVLPKQQHKNTDRRSVDTWRSGYRYVTCRSAMAPLIEVKFWRRTTIRVSFNSFILWEEELVTYLRDWCYWGVFKTCSKERDGWALGRQCSEERSTRFVEEREVEWTMCH